MTTKKKLMDEGPIDYALNDDLNHSFDEDDVLSPSPDRKAEMA